MHSTRVLLNHTNKRQLQIEQTEAVLTHNHKANVLYTHPHPKSKNGKQIYTNMMIS